MTTPIKSAADALEAAAIKMATDQIRALAHRIEPPDQSAEVAAALEAACNAIEDYPRTAPDADEWKRYDEQIDHNQKIIRALITPTGQSALSRMIAEAEARGYDRAVLEFMKGTTS